MRHEDNLADRGHLGPGDSVDLGAGGAGTRLLRQAGTPTGKPVARYGPFAMLSGLARMGVGFAAVFSFR
jgi:redox-sensitive bicupin YhaK (pirin superfamily)